MNQTTTLDSAVDRVLCGSGDVSGGLIVGAVVIAELSVEICMARTSYWLLILVNWLLAASLFLCSLTYHTPSTDIVYHGGLISSL